MNYEINIINRYMYICLKPENIYPVAIITSNSYIAYFLRINPTLPL